MNKTLLSCAITLTLTASFNVCADSSPPASISITNMLFDDAVYATGGSLEDTGTGAINSVDLFFDHTWSASQQTVFLNNTDSWNDTVTPSVQGPFNYDAELAAMTDDQVAVGIFFNWSSNNEIAVLEIFDCDANNQCTGNGVAMANGPFAGSVALFNAGLSCKNGFASTAANEPRSINIAVDVLGNDAQSIADAVDDASHCSNPLDTVTPLNPAGLTVTGVSAATAQGGMAVLNGSVIDYTPPTDFEGPDSFTFTATDDTAATTEATFDVKVGETVLSNLSMLSSEGEVFGGTNDVEIIWDETTFNDLSDDGIGDGVPRDTDFDAMTIASPTPFFNFNWKAHHIRIFRNTTGGPVTLKFDVTCESSDYDSGKVLCNKPLATQGAKAQFISMTLEHGEIGGHILLDWGKANPAKACGVQNCDTDVVNYWKQDATWDDHGDAPPKNTLWQGAAGPIPSQDAIWRLVSADVAGYVDVDGVSHDPGEGGNGINGAPMLDGAFAGSYANFNYKPVVPPVCESGQIIDPDTGLCVDNTTTTKVSLAAMNYMHLLFSLFILYYRNQISRCFFQGTKSNKPATSD